MSAVAFSRRLQSSGVWAGSCRVGAGLLALATHGLLARSLDRVQYDRFVLIESSALVLSLLCMAGIPTVTLRLVRSDLAKGDTKSAATNVGSTAGAFGLTTVITILLTVGLVGMPGDFQGEILPRTWLPWILSVAVLSASLRILSEIYRAYDRYAVAYAIGGQSGGVLQNASLLVLCLTIAVAGQISVRTVVTLQIFVQLTVLLAFAGEYIGAMRLFRTAKSRRLTGLLLLSSWPLMLQQLVTVGLPEAGKLFLGANGTGAGLYNAAARLVLLAHVPLMIVNTAIQPFIAELVTVRRSADLTTLLRGSATLAAIPCLLMLAPFLLIPHIVLQFSFGPEYVEAAQTLRILALGSAVWVVSGSCGLVLMMTGHERSCMAGTIVPGLAYLVCCPWLISEYGVVGAAAASSLLQFASTTMCLMLVFYHHRIWTTVTCSRTIVLDCIRLVSGSRKLNTGDQGR